MKLLRKLTVVGVAAVLTAGLLTVISPNAASAHGALMVPASRTYACYQDGLTPQGNIVNKNAGCIAAANISGVSPLYNWFSVLRSDGAGRTRGFVPDGQLCSGGNSTFRGWDLARSDFPKARVSSGATVQFRYSNWAAHPGRFDLYVTRNGWNPNSPLTWNDIESTPFSSVTNPPQNGSVGSQSGHYYWSGRLPSGKSGHHIIYSVWTRSDSQETFYGCSDVTF
ncbi:lytic polysaccharide monooxygenase [Plantactinospora solaniradicis]|uniref:Lytic polysaccharide monooxygenase n=1 Tax=Plantactinospora solaniradicis TaxID=1723736 RepID=A0ABW1K6K5_9ACTN